jgi:hypothetical protein
VRDGSAHAVQALAHGDGHRSCDALSRLSGKLACEPVGLLVFDVQSRRLQEEYHLFSS